MSVPCDLTIEQGKLRGSTATDIRGSQYFTFQGIPYAKPPLGELRFKAPQKPEKWNGVFDATKEGSPSIARDIHRNIDKIGSENCLVLNVYTKQFQKKLPVLFWIHGGGFIWGSSTTYEYGPDFLITEDVVVVSINYRLGMLGFLSLKDNSLGVPGNAGLKDMVMALKWVQKNISSFGGDPGNVTIFGESAGGAAVHLLTLSPMAKGLFHKAIAQSGCALNPWVKGRHLGADIAKTANLGNVDDRAVLNYVKGLTADEIFDLQNKIEDTLMPNQTRPFGFVVESKTSEEPFLTQEPIDIIKSGNFNHVPFMIGFTTAETICFDFFKVSNPAENINFENVIPFEFGYQAGSAEIKAVAEKIKKFYYGNEEPSLKNIMKKFNMETDIFFLHGIFKTVTTQSAVSKCPIYLYQMSIETELNFMKKLVKATVPGVSHCDDLGYLFKNYMTPEIKPKSLEDMGLRRFVKMWTNFATFGNPVPQKNDLLGTDWKPVKPNEVYFLDIGEKLSLKINPEPARLQFWKNLDENSPAAK